MINIMFLNMMVSFLTWWLSLIWTSNIIYDIYIWIQSCHVNKWKVSHLLIIMLITVRLQPQQLGCSLPHIFFHYLKTVNYLKQNWKSLRPTYALIWAILICYLNLQHLIYIYILDQVITESSRSRQGSDKYTGASWKEDALESATPCFCAI